ncbi:MAG: MgtC/SapB family protein [Rhodospirillales bacterium]|nr:MgtC/SapB family protein [Rhodospirillales bacterium]
MDTLLAYWSHEELVTNGIILLHLLGALAVGVVVGYERSYHGRAAGIRTYALVCVSATVMTVINAYPAHWFGGLAHTPVAADPTRVIQGILTGIGFLGAGVIMKEGYTIRGLSTAASIWMTAAIGVVIGIGFYGAAMFAALLTIGIMSGLRSLETALPHQTLLHLTIAYVRDRMPAAADLREMMHRHGYEVADWSFHLAENGNRFEYQIVLQASRPRRATDLVDELSASDCIEFRLSPTRS